MSNYFRVAARTLTHLGAELITSDAIALNELIKNSFDAGSKTVDLRFEIPFDPVRARKIASRVAAKAVSVAKARDELTQIVSAQLNQSQRDENLAAFADLSPNSKQFAEELAVLADERCRIVVDDAGVGMAKDALINAFLVIGTPFKLPSRRRRKSNQRPVLGDKGIGRLSMMRLGHSALVVSADKASPRYNQVEFDWREFEDPEKFIEDIPLEIEPAKKKENSSESGTLVEVFGLKSSWGNDEIRRFVDNYLRRLRDPVHVSAQAFPVKVYNNGKYQTVPPIGKWFTDCADYRASYHFDPTVDEKVVALRRSIKWKKGDSETIREWTLSEIAALLGVDVDTLRSLGAIRAGCYWYNRARLSDPKSEFSPADIKKELDNWAGGFALYRDEFRIGLTGDVEEDWLQMAASALRGQGYRVNSIQTVGSIAISSRANPKLIDSANRQGLVESPEYDALFRLMQQIVLGDLRFLVQKESEILSKKAITEMSSEESMRKAEKDIQTAVQQLGAIRKSSPADARPAISDVRENLSKHVDYVKQVRKALTLAKEQKVEILELAGIGMSVEIVAHELARMTERTNLLLSELVAAGSSDDVGHVIESIQSQLKAVNKRLRAIDPLSPSGRQRREKFDIVKFIGGILEGYGPRFECHNVDARVTIDGSEKASTVQVHLVKGFIAHVMENMLSNSMYWLKQGIREGDTQRCIVVDFDSKGRFLEFSDNGPGVDPTHKDDVFSPYFSQRKKGKGLGLFIARELAEYHRGKLYMSESTDDDDRLRSFVMEFPTD